VKGNRRDGSGGRRLGLCALVLLVGCRPATPPLPGTEVTAEQAQLLASISRLGAAGLQPWSWQYELGPGCTLRIQRFFESRPDTWREQTLIDHAAEVVPYATGGFGVKARPTTGGGTTDLLDTLSQADAEVFARAFQSLASSCPREKS
jgi:hypothetical protein